MFSLIIAIVAIALAVAIAVVTMYHGGTNTLVTGRQEARAAQAVNEMMQIKGALTAYRASEGTDAPSAQALMPKYLSSIPDGWGVDVSSTIPNLTAFEVQQLEQGSDAANLTVCEQVNAKIGLPDPTPPSCDTVDGSFSGCCVKE